MYMLSHYHKFNIIYYAITSFILPHPGFEPGFYHCCLIPLSYEASHTMNRLDRIITMMTMKKTMMTYDSRILNIILPECWTGEQKNIGQRKAEYGTRGLKNT
jgi:hypothetical protein